MSRARVSVRAEVDWTAQDESSAVLLVRAAHAPDQEIVEETLVVEGARVEEGPFLDDGGRPIRLQAPAGEVRLRLATGRDAADVARATGDGALVLDDLRVAAASMGPPR